MHGRDGSCIGPRIFAGLHKTVFFFIALKGPQLYFLVVSGN